MTGWRDRLKDYAEKAVSSGVEQFAVVAFAGAALIHVTGLAWAPALLTGAGAFVLSLITSLLTWPVGPLPYLADLAVRVVKSFGQSVLATLSVGVLDVTRMHWVWAFNVAAGVALLTLVKGLLSPNAQLSPSLLPTPVVARMLGVELTGNTFKAGVAA